MALISGQVDKVMMDTGVFYINGNMVSPCEGDNVLAIIPIYRDIPYNGSQGKTKGLKRMIGEDATLTVHPKGLTQSMLKYALPGADLSGEDIQSGGGRQVIADAAYLDEIALIGDTVDGLTKIITLHRVLASNGLNLTLAEDNETILELVFDAHYDPDDLSAIIYSIEDGDAYGY